LDRSRLSRNKSPSQPKERFTMSSTKDHEDSIERVLLLLDLAEKNKLAAEDVLDRYGHDGRTELTLQATTLGAQPSGAGWDPRQVRAWAGIIDKLAAAAQEQVDPHVELLVAGRAGLAAFAHLGLRVSDWHGNVALVNRRRGPQENDEWDYCSSRGGDPSSPPYFDVVEGLGPGRGPVSRGHGRVAVVVSSGYEVSDRLIDEFFTGQGETCLGTVELRAVPPRDLGAKHITQSNSPSLAEELAVLLKRIPIAYPNHRGLAVFIVGPVQLAFFTGRAINPHVFGSVWFAHKDGDHYAMGSMVPWMEKVRIRYLMADPSDTAPINAAEEEANMIATLDRPVARGWLDLGGTRWGTFDAIFELLLTDKPQVVHFSGHGNDELLAFVKEDGTMDKVPIEALLQALESTVDRDRPVRLVVLNACWSAGHAALLIKHVDFAIGMPYPVKNQRAVDFSRRFYGGLASGETLSRAFHQARAFLRKYGEGAADNVQLFWRDGCDPDTFRFFEPRG
jgi:hypothetical protein